VTILGLQLLSQTLFIGERGLLLVLKPRKKYCGKAELRSDMADNIYLNATHAKNTQRNAKEKSLVCIDRDKSRRYGTDFKLRMKSFHWKTSPLERGPQGCVMRRQSFW
jgi:hypothetical protein